MSLLSDVIDFCRSRMPEGASFSEIREFLELEDKEELKNLLNDAINRQILAKLGEKRGTRYIINGTGEITDSSNETEQYTGANKQIEAYLNDSTPHTATVVSEFVRIIKFKQPKNLAEFVQNGTEIRTHIISYNHLLKKNEIVETHSIKRMNYFAVKFDGKSPILKKVDYITNKQHIQDFPDYSELREELRKCLYEEHRN